MRLRRGAPARLNLRIETHAVCDPRVHPEVVHVGAEGQLAWKGRDTARLSLALYAPTPPPLEANAAPPGIAAEAPFDLQTVRIASCGLRDAGAPFGDVAMEVRVYDAAQWLTEVRHPAWEPMVWPASGRGRRRRRRPTCKLEKDGAPADAAAWQQSLARPARRLSRRHGAALQRVGAGARQRSVAARGRGVAAGRPGRRHLGLAAHVGLDAW